MINSCNINENFDSSNRIMFSIIVPVYQVEKYLNDCINSILNQSYKDYEIILVDDGSYDLSPIICDQYQNKYSNIKAIHKQNKGLSSARNIGLLNAKGDYILFIDSDDLWVDDVQILEKIAIKLNKYHCDVLIFNYKKFNSSKVFFPYLMEKEVVCGLTNIIEKNLYHASAWNKCVRRAILIDNNLYFKEGITSEDIDWCLRLAINTDKMLYIPDSFYLYRQREKSISKSMNCNKVIILKENILYCLKLLENCSNNKKKELNPYVSYQYGTLLFNVTMIEDKDVKKEVINELSKYKYLLNYSRDVKIRLLKYISKVFGFAQMFNILNLYSLLRGMI